MPSSGRMEILVSYDVSTETTGGRRRLRHVAEACEAYGQRVQKSVFECALTQVQLFQLEQRLLRSIDPREDRLRIYRLLQPRERYLRVYGVRDEVDFEDPLVV